MPLASLALLLIAFCGAPIFIIVLSFAMMGFWNADIPLTALAVELFRIADTPILVALPLFSLAGFILAESRASQRLVRVTQALLGSLPGGLAIIAFVTCSMFTAFTGASGVTIVAVGALLYPALQQVGYSQRFSLGLVTMSGGLGILLAPALPLILYGIVAQQMGVGEPFTLQDIFVAGLLPALLMITCLSLWSIWTHRHVPIARQPFNVAELKAALIEARWEAPLPFIVLGGIYGGWFAISETAAVTLAYVILAEVVLYRDIRFTQIPGIIIQCMKMVGGVMMILSASLALTNVLIDAEVPSRLFDIINDYIHNKLQFLIALNLFLLMLGCILDIFSAIVIMVPILLPIAVQYGIHPVHLGIIFLANMQIGYTSPPAGMDLFISSYRFNKPITELYRAALPFIGVLLFVLLLITYIPGLSLAFLK
jgi:C4-dicarboxylate transporter DctM subunit